MTRPQPAPLTVAHFFQEATRSAPSHPCLVGEGAQRSYAQVLERVQRWAGLLQQAGVVSGDRVAILSRNRTEYLEILLACAWTGAILAAQNWRLADPELAYCLDLVRARVLVTSPDEAARVADRTEVTWILNDALEERLGHALPVREPEAIDPGEPLMLLYTSGTTGRPKAAMISHRAEIARNLVMRAEFGLRPHDAYACWTPLYHMGGLEYSLSALLGGGTVFVLDGFDAERLADIVAEEPLGWLMLMPGMVGRFAEVFAARNVRARSVRLCGVMADLVPPADIARITRLVDAPYANTFGATETGCPPCSSSLLAVGEVPTSLAKQVSPFCAIRLVGPDGEEVPDGEPGELWMRGPTLFSGYWENPDATGEAFAGGWYHMGDVFRRLPDGRYDFVDRVKYLIKSGGENIYPAEIERVLLAQPGVVEAAVVRRLDAKWGEVPVAVVARSNETVTPESLVQACRAQLASYKKPKDVVFIEASDFPRSASGKVQRHVLEATLEASR